jgi:hypothetical protein
MRLELDEYPSRAVQFTSVRQPRFDHYAKSIKYLLPKIAKTIIILLLFAYIFACDGTLTYYYYQRKENPCLEKVIYLPKHEKYSTK